AGLTGRGARHIAVMPCFWAAGSHVIQDIPEILDAFRVSHPDICLTLNQHIGNSNGMGRLILDIASA
ncbi:MAG: CbiX/SirB N-terminal domain-containing protein, partial [Candidatus Nitrotoga sp.]